MDFEVEVVRQLHWSLHEIDETNTESLFDFVGRLNSQEKQAGSRAKKRVYCDQVPL